MIRSQTRALALILAVMLMLAALAGCGSNSGADQGSQTPTEASTTAPEAPANDQSEPEEPAFGPVVLTVSSSYGENESGAKNLNYFCDYIEEATGGAVTFKRYFGGTLGSRAEELGLLSSGAIDVCAIAASVYQNDLPLIAFPMYGVSSVEEAVEAISYMCFGNEELAAIFQSEAHANNFHYVGGAQAGGAQGFVSKKSNGTLDEIRNLTLGTSMAHNFFAKLGIKNVVQSSLGDGYENLSRGVIDEQFCPIGPAYSMMWYEVADYYTYCGTYAVGNLFSINLDTWNSLPADIQAIFTEAGFAAQEYSIQVCLDEMAVAEEAFTQVSHFSEEDGAEYLSGYFENEVADALTRARAQGIEAEMTEILTVFAEVLGEGFDPANYSE